MDTKIKPVPETAVLATDMVVLHRPLWDSPVIRPGDRVTHVLLILRSDTGTWALPGGKMDVGETFLTAGVRELSEETGVTVDPEHCHPVKVYDAPGRDPRGRYITQAFGVFLRDGRPEPRVQPGETDRVEWVPVSEALGYDFYADHRAILRDALALSVGWWRG